MLIAQVKDLGHSLFKKIIKHWSMSVKCTTLKNKRYNLFFKTKQDS